MYLKDLVDTIRDRKLTFISRRKAFKELQRHYEKFVSFVMRSLSVDTFTKSSNKDDILLAFDYAREYNDLEVYTLLAQNEHLPPGISRWFIRNGKNLGRERFLHIACLLAKNPAIPEDVIDELVKMNRHDILLFLLKNKSFTTDLFRKYSDYYFERLHNKSKILVRIVMMKALKTYAEQHNIDSLKLFLETYEQVSKAEEVFEDESTM